MVCKFCLIHHYLVNCVGNINSLALLTIKGLIHSKGPKLPADNLFDSLKLKDVILIA